MRIRKYTGFFFCRRPGRAISSKPSKTSRSLKPLPEGRDNSRFVGRKRNRFVRKHTALQGSGEVIK